MRGLTVRTVQRRRWVGIEPTVTHVFDYADDGQPRIFRLDGTEFNVLSQRVLSGEVAPGERFGDHRNSGRFETVPFAECTPLAQCHVHRLKIVRADVLDLCEA